MDETTRNSNRLADELSPYLRMHAENPVDWYPWGDAALRRARDEDRPIFLSIGYSTCYWCHVMERESFSDPGIAAFLNRHFVNIKVDREERPELDEIYMAATQAYAGQGGWPNTLFLTPSLEPYFAGTYFPPEPRQGRPSFAQVLEAMADAWKNRRPDVEEQARSVVAAARHYLEDRGQPAQSAPGAEPASRSLAALRRAFDPDHGGFGAAPKFPSPGNLLLLLAAAEEGEAEADRMLRMTLDQMARGGIFDQLAGGFHRYSTDRAWRLPHFEKMLYDNGILLEVYGQYHRISGDGQAAEVCRRIAEFLETELHAPQGGYWSALDAETEGGEGAFYVWTREQLRAALGEEDFGFVAPLYGVAAEPFFGGDGYVLHIPEPWEALARRRRTSVEALRGELEPHRLALLERRSQRPRPATDDKILTDWNGIVIRGLAVAGAALEDAVMIGRAASTADLILETMRRPGTLHHVSHRETVAVPGLLSDYVFLIGGLLALARVQPDGRWLRAAEQLREEQEVRLSDGRGGFYSAAESTQLIARSREIFDGALPSGNGQAALNDLELYELTGDHRWLAAARDTLCAFAETVLQRPEAARLLALAARRLEGLESETFSSPRREDATEARPTASVNLRREALENVKARLEFEDERPDGWHGFRVEIEIAPGWHAYAPMTANREFQPLQLRAAPGCEIRALGWPEPVSLEEGAAVYRGAIVVRGEIRCEAGTVPAVQLSFQACDETRCLPPVVLGLGR